MADANPSDDKAKLDKMSESIASLTESMTTMVSHIQQQNQSIVELRAAQSNGSDDAPNPEQQAAPNLETMDRQSFMNYITQNIVSALDEKIAPVSKQVGDVEQTVQNRQLQASYLSTKHIHKDFEEWKDEMQPIAQRLPDLSFEELYTLARNSNSEKAAEMDEKYKEEEPPKPNFGGLSPSGSMTVEKTDMDEKEAADSAWDKTVAVFGDQLSEISENP